MREKLVNILWGIILITIGILIAGASFELWEINLYFDGWWSLFIIVPCILSLLKHGHRTGSMIGLIIGFLILLSANDMVSREMIEKLTIPFILIYFGLNVLLRNLVMQRRYTIYSKGENGNVKEYYNVFSSGKGDFNQTLFEGSDISAIFGGFTLDLSNAVFNHDVVINCTAIFGGTDIYLPANINVKTSSISIFGGTDKKYRSTNNQLVPTVFINTTCLFGGVNIK